MGLTSKLDEWVAAGLIDGDTAARIRVHEAESARPIWLWAIAGLGGLALVLGVIAIVAANWADIPAGLKLGVHMLLTAAAAAFAWRGLRKGDGWMAEIALFLLSGLTLAGLALQSQVYQLSGDLWVLLLIWLAAAGPALVAFGQSRLTAYTLVGMTIWTVAAMASAMDGSSVPELLVQGLAIASPWALIALVAATGARGSFAAGIEEGALVVLLPAVSIAHMAWADSVPASDAGEMLIRFLVVIVAAGLSVVAEFRSGRLPRGLVLPLLLGPFAALFLAACIPHSDWWLPRLIGAFLFFAMWAWIGWASMRAGWRTLFAVSVAAVAIRIFIVYFELFGTLAMTGVGLILAGALLIGLAFAGRRVLKEMPQ